MLCGGLLLLGKLSEQTQPRPSRSPKNSFKDETRSTWHPVNGVPILNIGSPTVLKSVLKGLAKNAPQARFPNGIRHTYGASNKNEPTGMFFFFLVRSLGHALKPISFLVGTVCMPQCKGTLSSRVRSGFDQCSGRAHHWSMVVLVGASTSTVAAVAAVGEGRWRVLPLRQHEC